MQGKNFEIKNQTFRSDQTVSVDVDRETGKVRDTNALGLVYRPYWTDDQIPADHVFGPQVFLAKNILVEDCEIDGRGVAEGLKISFGHDVTIRNCIIHGGYEDCVDIVRGANICFSGCKFISYNTKQHFTIKGGCKNIQIEDCEFVNDFKNWYDGAILDIGNWCDYDQVKRPKVRHVKVNDCRLTNIKFKMLSRVLYGEAPTIIETGGFVFKVPSFITSLFFKLRNSGKLGKIKTISRPDRLVYNIEKI